MNALPIPDALAGGYKGAGYALAAHRDGEMLDLIYLRDVLPVFSDHDENGDAIHLSVSMLKDVRLGPTIRHLEQLGDVSVGLCSSWEFCEL